MAAAEIEILKQKLLGEREKIWRAVDALTSEERTRAVDGGWSVQDILAHLAMAEAVNVRFAQMMLAQDAPVQLSAMAQDFPDYAADAKTFSLDSFNAYMTDKLRVKSWAQVVAELRDVRAETLAWVDTLTPEQLARGGQHAAWGDQTVRGMLKILALHDKAHLQDIARVKRNT